MATVYRDLHAPHAKDAALSVIADMGVASGVIGDFEVRLSENGGSMTPVVFALTVLGDYQFKFDIAGSVMDTAGVACLLVSGATRQAMIYMTVEDGAKTNGEIYADLDSGGLLVGVDLIDTDVIDAASLKADAVTEIATAIWNFSTRTLTSLGSATIQAIWDAQTSALTTAGSIGKMLVDNLDAVISAIETKIDGIKTKTDGINFDAVATSAIKSAPVTALSVSSADIASIADAVVDHATTTGGGDVKTCLRDAQGLALGSREMKNVNLVAGTAQEEMKAADNSTVLGTFNVTLDANGKPTKRTT